MPRAKVGGGRINLRIDDDLHELVAYIADETGVSVSQLVRGMLEQARPSLVQMREGLEAAKRGDAEGAYLYLQQFRSITRVGVSRFEKETQPALDDIRVEAERMKGVDAKAS